MRLGFWNRLALVLGTLGAFAFPSWWALSTNLEHSRVMNSGYKTCVAAASERLEPEGWENCFNIWLEPKTGYVGWSDWLQAVLWAVPVMALIYGLIWVVVWIAKWVLRGRTEA